jgi:hypothetical protein
MKLPPCSSQLRSHSRTGHDSAFGSGVIGVNELIRNALTRGPETIDLIGSAPGWMAQAQTDARAGALSIRPFQVGRSRLRRTRSLYMGFECHFGTLVLVAYNAGRVEADGLDVRNLRVLCV